MHYGGDYNPEQWSTEVWDEDIRLMREAGVTLVSVGIFSWSRLQPAEGEFDFAWLDDVLDRLHAAGIAVDLATATASPPPWAHAAYPEMLPVTADGVTLGPGSRQHYAPTSPVYRRLASELVEALAQRYVDHPAVVMWHVNNEYGCHLDQDYSDAAAVAFRSWLRERYGSIDALNRAWGTDFWSQRYTDFDQVLPPRAAPYEPNPAQHLDFRRFSSDALLRLFLMEKEILLRAGATQPITTNFMGTSTGMDYWAWAPHMDVISDDCYPDPHDGAAFRTTGAFHRDLMRSLAGGPGWMLMEQASGAVNWRRSNASKPQGMTTAQSMQAVARGADAVMFFQWRQSRAGTEKFHSAMVPHAGRESRIWREIVALGADLAALPPLPREDGTARVAIVLNWDDDWALERGAHPVRLDNRTLIGRWHAAFHELGIGVDFVHPAADLTRYDLVIAAPAYVLTDQAAANLVAFAEGGGTLVVGAFTDVVDENDAFVAGGFTTRLRAALGSWVTDFGALDLPGGSGTQRVDVTGEGMNLVGEYLAEELTVSDAEVLARFATGLATGGAALTRRDHGAGQAFHLATVPDVRSTLRLARLFADAAGVHAEIDDLPAGVEAARRGPVLTLINHGDTEATVDVVGRDLLTGHDVTSATLAPFGWVMLEKG